MARKRQEVRRTGTKRTIFTSITCFILIGPSILSALAQDPSSPAQKPAATGRDRPKPPVRVTISKETTWITEPLREDGYPDYVRYLNEKLSKGVTPENNAIVPLARTMGLLDVEDHIRTEYFKLLGIEPPPKDAKYFETWWSYTSRTPEAEQPRVPPGDKRLQKDYFAQLVEEAASRPWTRQEFLHVAKWLDGNEQHLNAFVAASKLPRAYSPWIIAPDEQFAHPLLITAYLVDADMIGDAAQALRCRAMRRADKNTLQRAQEDLLAAQRWAVLLAQSPHLVHFFVAKDVECKTRIAAIQLCAHIPSSRRLIFDFRNRRIAFDASATVTRAIDIGERLSFLDATCYIAREGWQTLPEVVALITDLSTGEEPKPRKDRGWAWNLSATTMAWFVRWDEPLSLGNDWYDRLVRIARVTDPHQQIAVLDQFDKDLQKLQSETRELPTQAGFFFYPRTIATRFTSNALVGIFMPPVQAAFSAARQLDTFRSMFKVSMALYEYRADQKQYPDTLKKLLPQYIDRLPVDDFGRRDFVYRKTEAGFLLYSLGRNGRDDSGKTYDDDPNADDIVIRVPATNGRIPMKP